MYYRTTLPYRGTVMVVCVCMVCGGLLVCLILQVNRVSNLSNMGDQSIQKCVLHSDGDFKKAYPFPKFKIYPSVKFQVSRLSISDGRDVIITSE